MTATQKNATQRLEQMLGMAALLLLLIGCFTILSPFMTAIMWSVILSFSLWPMQRILTKWFRGRKTLAAIVVAISVSTLLVGPVVLLGFGLADDAANLGKTTKKWVESASEKPPEWVVKLPIVGNEINERWTQFAETRKEWLKSIDKGMKEVPPRAKVIDENGEMVDPEPLPADAPVYTVPELLAETDPASAPDKEPGLINEGKLFEQIGKFFAWAHKWLLDATISMAMGIVQIALSIVLTFFILRNGQELGARLAVAASRIAGARGQRLIAVAGNTVRGVVYGIIGTAVAQGVLAGLGFGMAGVPAAALLGVLTFFLSALPMGPPLVWIPATIWLFSVDKTGWAVFLLIWGMFIVSGIDNIIKPYLISHGAQIPFVVVFMGVIGGALAFGLVGVFLGPTLLAVAYRVIEEWSSANALLQQETAAKHGETTEPVSVPAAVPVVEASGS
jgi:predicted PurR-regulated permease PerM